MRYIGTDDVPLALTVAEFRRAIPATDVCPDDDERIEAYLRAAQEVISYATGRPLVPGEYEFFLPGPCRRWWFPCVPVGDLVSIAAMADDGTWQDQSLDGVRLVNPHGEPQLVLPGVWDDVMGHVHQVRVRAVIGDDRPPLALVRATILLAKEWLVSDISIGELETPALALGITRLIRQRRYMRPREFA